MSRRGWMIIGVYLVILLLAGWFLFGKKILPKKEIHYHAGFVVFQDDKKLDFSDNKYMNVKPCVTGGETPLRQGFEGQEEDEQLEKAHLHDNVGDVVHVEADGALWKDLFTNIHYPVDYSKTNAFVNGQRVYNFANLPIRPYDSVVMFIGDVDENKLKEAVSSDYIKEKEKKSDDC